MCLLREWSQSVPCHISRATPEVAGHVSSRALHVRVRLGLACVSNEQSDTGSQPAVLTNLHCVCCSDGLGLCLICFTFLQLLSMVRSFEGSKVLEALSDKFHLPGNAEDVWGVTSRFLTYATVDKRATPGRNDWKKIRTAWNRRSFLSDTVVCGFFWNLHTVFPLHRRTAQTQTNGMGVSGVTGTGQLPQAAHTDWWNGHTQDQGWATLTGRGDKRTVEAKKKWPTW